MSHIIPIYFSNVVVSIYKKTKVNVLIKSFKLEKQVIKGFNFDDFVKRNSGSIFENASKTEPLSKSKEFDYFYKIEQVNLLIQLGFGVAD